MNTRKRQFRGEVLDHTVFGKAGQSDIHVKITRKLLFWKYMPASVKPTELIVDGKLVRLRLNLPVGSRVTQKEPSLMTLKISNPNRIPQTLAVTTGGKQQGLGAANRTVQVGNSFTVSNIGKQAAEVQFEFTL